MPAYVKYIISDWVLRFGPPRDVVVYAASMEAEIVAHRYIDDPRWPTDQRCAQWVVTHKASGKAINLHRLCRDRAQALELAAALEPIARWDALHELTEAEVAQVKDKALTMIDEFMSKKEGEPNARHPS